MSEGGSADGVMMQAFYWNCPDLEGKAFVWWKLVRERVPALAAAGFTALRLPPANKAASNTSMGYDPYDYFDVGEFDQKGSVATWFGTRDDLAGRDLRGRLGGAGAAVCRLGSVEPDGQSGGDRL